METNTASPKKYATIPFSALAVTIGSLLLAPAASATIFINADMTEASHEFYPEDEMMMEPSQAYSKLAALNPAAFVHDFSAAGDTQITINWQAPAGQQFVVTSPADSDAYVTAEFRGGNSYVSTGGGISQTSNVDLTLNNLAGTATLGYVSRQLTGSTSGNLIALGGMFVVSPGSTITFTSATLTTTIPAAFATNFNTAINNFVLTVSSSPATDPGAMISLQAIPEPSTYAALFGALALGAVVLRRRRGLRLPLL